MTSLKKIARNFWRHMFPAKPFSDVIAADFVLASYPKTGRTWLRLMLAKAIALHFKLKNADLFDTLGMARHNSGIPRITVNHGGDRRPFEKTADELTFEKSVFHNKKVVLLTRDIRDIVVSFYFELTRRIPVFHSKRLVEAGYEGDMSSFLRYERGSVSTIIAYYNLWVENRDLLADLLLIHYEEMRRDPHQTLRRVMDFIGLPDVSDAIIAEAVEFARFENMRQMEADNALDSSVLKAANPDDPESFKTRRGKVGGFVDYLSEDDIKYLDNRIKNELSDFYGYHDPA